MRSRICCVALFFIWGLFPTFIFAEESVPPDTEQRIYEFPILDFPYNDGRAPSMSQSLRISRDFYFVTHNYILDAQIGDLPIHSGQKINILPIVLFDIASLWLPFGSTWAHEEWHRAAIGQRGVNSQNNIYHFDTSTSAIDADIQNLKKSHPQDLVRALSAGMESAYELNLDFEKQAFFNNHHPLIGALIHVHVLNNISYMHICTTSDGVGGDCTVWVYELFRPTASIYQDSVVLTADEQRYLVRQRNLSLLNVIDPMLIGKREFVTPSGDWHWNANLRHMLTPFGYDIAANVFLKSRDDLNIFGAIHTYHNDQASSLGIDVTLPRYATQLFDKPVHVTPRVFAWIQPENLMFRDSATKPGGLVSMRVDVPIEDGWEIYGEVEGKSKGWVAGNEYLGNSTALRMGFNKVIQTKSRWGRTTFAGEKQQ